MKEDLHIDKILTRVFIWSFFLLTLIFFVGFTKAFASSSGLIEADVKIGVCGDSEATGIEQCDNSDLRGRLCENFGYDEGTLNCDAACDFDFTACEEVTEDQEENNLGAGNSNVQNNNSESNSVDSFLLRVLPLIDPFDLNNNGAISQNELSDIVAHWVDVKVENSAEICDVNIDGVCNIVDFSILMYYVNK